MRLEEIASAESAATELVGIRVDKETKADIVGFRNLFGSKSTATWLRNVIREAVRSQKTNKKKSP